MSEKQPAWMNPSQNAVDLLNMELSKKDTAPEDVAPVDEAPVTFVEEPMASVEDAQSDTIQVDASGHARIRLLLVTKDASILEVGSLAHSRIANLQVRFREIHILVLDHKVNEAENPVIRIFENVWGYTTKSKSWWRLGFDAYRLVETQLVFSGGFRVDVIVSEDLSESGIVGYLLGKKYKRPFQVHIYEDFFDNLFIKTQRHSLLYEWAVQYLMDRVQSVRTKTEFQKNAVTSLYPRLKEKTEVLPSYYNLTAWRDVVPTVNLREKYPQFKFIILHVSSMRVASHTNEVIQGTAQMLRRYPTLGLVIVGNGPLRSQLEQQVIALGLPSQIEFEPMSLDTISYMKTANIFIHISEDGGEDDLILQAAVSKIPLVANVTGLAGKLFVHEESACLCNPTDPDCVAESINRYLNENQDRTRYALSASETVFERVEQDYNEYLDAVVDSIERCTLEQS